MEWQAQRSVHLLGLHDAFEYDITHQISYNNNLIVASGASGDVCKGIWSVPRQLVDARTGRVFHCVEQRPVAIKELRIFSKRYPTWSKAINKFCHEIHIWRWLDHINVLPFYGYTVGMNDSVALISPWCEFGTLPEYLERDPTASRENLMLDVIEGLAYLHEQNPPVVHADLRGSNIFINIDGTARIGDFGLATLSDVEVGQLGLATLSDMGCGSPPWMAPELFMDEAPQKTLASDMYALGGLFIEILSGKTPYYYLPSDYNVLVEVCSGNPPRRDRYELPPSETDLWQLAKFLWARSPADRPTAQAVVATLYAYFQLLPRKDGNQALRPSSVIDGSPYQFGALFPEEEILNDSLSPDGSVYCTFSRSAREIRFYDLTHLPTAYWSVPLSSITQNHFGSSRTGVPDVSSMVVRWSPNSSHMAIFTPLSPGSSTALIFTLINVRFKTCRPLPAAATWLHDVAFTKDGYLVLITQNRIGPQILFRETYAIRHGPLGYEFPHISDREPLEAGTELEAFGGLVKYEGDSDCIMQEPTSIPSNFQSSDAIPHMAPNGMNGSAGAGEGGGQHVSTASLTLVHNPCLSIYSPTRPAACTQLRELPSWANTLFWPLGIVPIQFSPCGDWVVSKLHRRTLTIWHINSTLPLITVQVEHTPDHNVQLAVNSDAVTLVIEGRGTFTRFYRLPISSL